MIDQMPSATRFAEAVSLDEEHVEQIVAYRETHPEQGQSRGPRLSEYGPLAERLDVMIDELRSNTAATIAAAGTKPPKVEPQPRPGTAFDQIKHRRRLAQHDALARRLLRRSGSP